MDFPQIFLWIFIHNFCIFIHFECEKITLFHIRFCPCIPWILYKLPPPEQTRILYAISKCSYIIPVSLILQCSYIIPVCLNCPSSYIIPTWLFRGLRILYQFSVQHTMLYIIPCWGIGIIYLLYNYFQLVYYTASILVYIPAWYIIPPIQK